MSIAAAAAAKAYAATSSIATPGKTAGMETGGQGFSQLLDQALQTVTDTAQQADKAGLQAVSGKADIVDVVTAVAESELALETLVSVRDRVISAYEEIMRMPI
ncbi:MAG TPA: flagellar hook-basal body complex protein FliE [Hyphomicrobiales bacterium]|nr:flagellar hook-basal body complex protein FliE [Rhodobiaceae bacterium]HXK54960.1 flagellar hook-basal body complex protein FliE [Hyphomicrobiales bacterium]